MYNATCCLTIRQRDQVCGRTHFLADSLSYGVGNRKGDLMKTYRFLWLGALLVLVLLLAMVVMLTPRSRTSSATSHRPELEYLKAVNSVAPLKDPELLFVLMTEFANANLQAEGVNFFSARLKEFEPRLTQAQ